MIAPGDFEGAYGEALRLVEVAPDRALARVSRFGSERGSELDTAQHARLLRLEGHCRLRQGRFGLASELYESAFDAQVAGHLKEDAGRTTIAWVEALSLHGSLTQARAVAAKGSRWIPSADKRARGALATNLGNAYHNAYDYVRARRCYRRALSLLGEAGDPGVFAQYGLAMVDLREGHLSPAQSGFDRCILDMQVLGATSWQHRPEIGLATIEIYRGDWNAGLHRLDAARAVCKQSGDQRALAHIERESAELFGALGAESLAIRSALRAYGIYEDLGLKHEIAESAWLLARLLATQESLVDAATYLERARTVWASLSNHRAVWRVALEEQRLLIEVGARQSVAPTLSRLQIQLDRSEPNGLGAVCLALRSRDHLENRRLAHAIRFAKQARRRMSTGRHRGERPKLALVVARAYQEQGLRANALRWLRTGVDELEVELQQFGDVAWRHEVPGARDPIYDTAIEILLKSDSPAATCAAVNLFSRATSPALLHQLLSSDVMPQVQGLRAALDRLRGRLLLNSSDDDGTRGAHLQREADRLGRKLRLALASNSIHGAKLDSLRGLQGWQEKLGSGSSVVMYQRHVAGWRAFHITRDGVTRVALPLAEAAVAEHGRSLHLVMEILASAPPSRRKSLLDRTRNDAANALKGLRVALWDPLQIESGRVAIVADGELHETPIESLVDGGGSGMLGPITTRVSHPSYLFAANRAPASSGDAVLLHGGTAGAQHELDVVRQILRASELTVRRTAQFDQPTKNESAPAVLHVAAHGVIHRTEPYLSGLQLGQSWLGAETIRSRQLAGSLVFLSSCSSGWSRRLPGRELHGWMNPALASKATQVVLSSWRIDDHGATAFAREFYRSWAQHRDAAAAAADARRALIAAGHHPYTWAGFQITDLTKFSCTPSS